MAVRIRMKKMGRKARPFFRICAVDSRSPRDGKVIEELGTYDPMIRDKDARAVLKKDRIDYWVGVGAQPTPKVGVLIRKYGTGGSHESEQQTALEKLGKERSSRATLMAATAGAPAATEVAESEAAAEPAAEAPAEGAES